MKWAPLLLPALAVGLVLMLMTAVMLTGKRATERPAMGAEEEVPPNWPRVGEAGRRNGWIFSRQPVGEKDSGEIPMYSVWFDEGTGAWSVVFDDTFGWYRASGQASYGTMEELLEYIRTSFAAGKTPFMIIGVDQSQRQSPEVTRDLTAAELQEIAAHLWTCCQLRAYPIPDGW